MSVLQVLEKNKKLLLVLPIIAIPFLTILFWILGGGSGDKTAVDPAKDYGLNLKLPEAGLSADDSRDKMSFYELAEKGLPKIATDSSADSLFNNRQSLEEMASRNFAGSYGSSMSGFGNSGINGSPYNQQERKAEQEVMTKLAQINDVVRQAQQPDTRKKNEDVYGGNKMGFSDEVGRLEEMVKYMSDRSEGEDPEMKQLENTLNKILDIQHPDRVKENLRQQSKLHKQSVFPVVASTAVVPVSMLPSIKDKNISSFYGIESLPDADETSMSVPAVLHETQSLTEGSVVRLRLSQAIFIRGVFIPAGTFVHGLAAINDERLMVEVSTVKYGSHIIPVKLQLYDSDGLAGVHIPNMVSREVSKQSADNSMQNVELAMLDPSFKAQMAGAGVATAKSFLGKKIKQVRVTVKAGYAVLLTDKSVDQ